MLNYTLGTIEASEALIKDLYIDLRAKVNAWSKITQQTPQARMGYVGQHLVSVVTGYPGGKSGARGYDLVIDDERHGEIKTCYRVDQLGSCNACGAVVSSLETECAVCSSTSINRKDDSKWLIAIRNNDEFAKLLDPYRYYFVLFEFESIYDSNNNDIIASIWEVDPKSKGFAYCMIDYYLNIRSQSTVADGLFCREIDGLFCRSSPDIIVRRRCVLSHKRRGWLQPSPSFRYSRNLALQDELYHPVINNGPAVLVCVDKRLGTGPVNQSRDAG